MSALRPEPAVADDVERRQHLQLSIVVPVYNERDNVERVIERLRTVELPPGVEREIIVVDDGSTDGTSDVLRGFHDEPGLIVHHSMVNLGKGVAARIGFKYASGDVIVIQDADLEYDPAELSRLLEPILAGRTDVVYGSRFLGRCDRMATAHVIGNRLLNITNNLLFGASLTDCYTCYKMFRRHVLDGVRLRARGFELEAELTAKIQKQGFAILELPINFVGRTYLEGKKIRKLDGFLGVLNLLRFRFSD